MCPFKMFPLRAPPNENWITAPISSPASISSPPLFSYFQFWGALLKQVARVSFCKDPVQEECICVVYVPIHWRTNLEYFSENRSQTERWNDSIVKGNWKHMLSNKPSSLLCPPRRPGSSPGCRERPQTLGLQQTQSAFSQEPKVSGRCQHQVLCRHRGRTFRLRLRHVTTALTW